MKHRLTALAATAALAVGVISPAFAAHKPDVHQARLNALNGSGADGVVTIVEKDFDGDGAVDLRFNLDVDGLNVDGPHLAHLHGVIGEPNRCPDPADESIDLDGDGLISLIEGAPDYGGILVTLSDGFQDTGTSLEYSRTFARPDGLETAEEHIVVHGVDVDGDGDLDGQKDVNGDGVIGDGDGTPLNSVLDLGEQAWELTMPALCGEIDQRN